MAEQKFYWLKLKKDFFKRHDIKIIESMPNGKDYVLFYLKMLCESVDHDGNLRFNEQIPYNEEMLSVITNTNIDIVRSAIKIFCQLNMMEILDNGTYFMNEVNKMIGCATDNANANRQRRYREKKNTEKLLSQAQSVTQALQNVTPLVTKNNEIIDIDKEIDKDIDKEIEYRDRDRDIDKEIDKEKENPEKKSINCFSKNFLSFLETYPEKRIDKNTDALYQVFMEYVPDQETWEKIESALPIQVNSKDWHNENGKYIPLASNYLRNRKWEEITIPPAPLKNAEPNPNRFLTGKFGSVSRY